MNIEAIYASQQLEVAMSRLCQGRASAAGEAIRNAMRAVNRIIRDPPPDPLDEPHSDVCLCRTCYETMLERL